LRPEHVDALLRSAKDTKTKKQASPRLRQQIYDFLKKALSNAVGRGTVSKNVCNTVIRPKVPKVEICPLDESQAEALIKASHADRFFALYVLVLNSGFRWGELAGLRWKDIDSKHCMISLQRGLITGKVIDDSGVKKDRPVVAETKSRRGRHVAVPRFVIDALQEHRERMLAEGHVEFVFCDTQGGPLRESNFTRRNFKPLLETVDTKLPQDGKLPKRFRFHDLRHTHATFLLKAGVHPKIVSERLGHATVAITLDLYSHVLPSMQAPAVEAMNRLFEGAVGSSAVLSAVPPLSELRKAL
jgi:integrase